MAEFKLGRIKFVWQGDWTSTATYYKDDVVRYGGKAYICVVGHDADADFYNDLNHVPTKWNQVADGTSWESDWTTNNYYKVNDLVKYGGNLYIANEGHTSAATATLGLEADLGKWDLFAEGFDYKGAWAGTTRYKINDVVRYGANSYVCNDDHTSQAKLEDDLSKWTVYTEGFEWKGDWLTATRYKIHDVVKYGGISYVCNEGHLSAATVASGLEADLGKWDILHKGIEYLGDWTDSNFRYRINDVVKYGAGTWICTAYHTSNTGTTFEAEVASNRWDQFVEGLEFESSWASATIYQPGDIVTYGGYAYVAKSNHSNQTPSTASAYWDLLTTGFKENGDWSSATTYKVGDVVRLNGYTYVAVLDGINHEPPNVTYWARLNSGIFWKGAWSDAVAYKAGDAVRYLTSTYICVLAHTSVAGTNRPDVDVAGTYWNVLASGNENDVLTTDGDLVYYSGAGPTRLPIGGAGQVLMSDGALPAWATWGVVPEVYYVAPHGADVPAPEYGLTIDRPWGSIRYACEQIEKGVKNLNAEFLLKMNRTFIQAEVVEYIDYKISNSIAPYTGLTYDKETCRRDVGLVIDALAYDLTHGSNFRTREAAQSYFDGGVSVLPGDQKDPEVDSLNYMLTIINSVIENLAPVTNYQNLNSVADPVLRFTDLSYNSEAEASSIITNLVSIITSVIADDSLDNLVAEDRPSYSISVKTGQYYEVLPIIVPAYTAIVGDELRSTKVSPQIKVIASNDKTKTVAALTHLQSITDEIIANTAVTPTTGNVETQNTSLKAGSVGSSTAITSVTNNINEMIDVITNGIGSADAYVYPNPTGYSATWSDARRLILANKTFLKDEVEAYMNVNYNSLWTSLTTDQKNACKRDIGYIVDALAYDLTYGETSGCNLATQIAARSYYSKGEFVENSNEKTAALAVQAYLKTIIDDIARKIAITPTSGNTTPQDVSGTAGGVPAATFAQSRIQEIYDAIDTGNEPTAIYPSFAWVSSSLQSVKSNIEAYKTSITTDSSQFVKKSFPTLVFDLALCTRDVGYMVDALKWDAIFGSNFLSIQNALSYFRALSSTQLVLAEQKPATLSMLGFLKQRMKQVAANGASTLANLIWTDVINYIDTGSAPVVTGVNTSTKDVAQINGAIVLQANKEFLAAEAVAYINNTYKTTVTASTGSTTDTFTCGNTSWMVAGDAIRFTGTTFGGVSTGTTYYVHTVVNGTDFKISTSLGGAVMDLSTSSGSMTVSYHYNSALCARDVRHIIDAMSYDLQYVGNYKSVLAARYYRSALTGSKLEDFFYVRNACGLRNMSFIGLDGTSDGNTTGAGDADGLSAENAYGTKRPLAGSYVSLDPGWGPNDSRVWTTTRSTYVQNVTTFGTGCVGQKIDGILHNGGNKSIVSNDFTQVLDDGIGAWVTNLGLAELVSVFTYYNYAGYLAENGGKIRATNGNNSYGEFGSIAEGFDVTETAISGSINNRNTEADVRNIVTSGNQILLLEYGNAGMNYSTATYSINGAGSGASAIGDEIRSNGVFEVRMTDPGDSSGPGGTGYITAANLAQSGNTTQITLAATDTNSSLAYVGMRIDIISGTGVGQYAYIDTYNAGSKIATVKKISNGSAGWDHYIPGTAIASALDVTTSYSITPRVEFSAPAYSRGIFNTASAAAWSDVVYGAADGLYTGVTQSSTSGGGSLAQFTVARREGVYSVTVTAGGALYQIGDTVTLAGTSAGGTSPANDVVLTVTKTSGSSGAITGVSVSGTAITGKYVAVSRGSSTVGGYSTDGATWAASTLPGVATDWNSVAYGITTSTGIGVWVAIAASTSRAAYSTNGTTWTTASLPTTAGTWTSVTFGNGRFVAVASGSSDSAYSTDGGVTWTAMGALPASTTWTSVTYGAGKFVAVASGGTQAAYSTNGTTWSATGALPASTTWTSVAFGKNRFVAVASGGTQAAYSLNGTSWTSATLSAGASWISVSYGNGVFVAVAPGQVATSSSDGITWTSRSVTHASPTVTSGAKDVIGSFAAHAMPQSAFWTNMLYSGSKFIAVGNNQSDTGYAASSTDGLTWSDVTIPSTAGWEFTAIAYNGTNKYVVFISNDRDIVTSTDGVTWAVQNSNGVNNLPASRLWTDAVYGGTKFVVIANAGTNPSCYSTDGTTWTQGTMASGSWSSVTYGQPGATAYFVAVSGSNAGGSQAAAYSADGITWTTGNTLPSSDVWSSITYGAGVFVTVAGDSTTATTKAAYSSNGTTWTAATLPGVAAKWTTVSYGLGGFMAFEYGGTRTAVSADGITWVEGPTNSSGNWITSSYGNNKFVALKSGSSGAATEIDYVLNTNYLTTASTTNLSLNDAIVFSGTTFSGISAGTTYYVKSVVDATRFTVSSAPSGSTLVLSTGSGSMPSTVGKIYTSITYGSPSGAGKWIAVAGGASGATSSGSYINVGTLAQGRAYVSEGKIAEIWMHEPGSAYTTAPTISITDPNNTGADATYDARLANGVLAQPSWVSRGNNYTAASATITGDGYADRYQVGTYVYVENLTDIPVPGSNFQIAGIDDVYYRVVTVTELTGTVPGPYGARIQVSPSVNALEAPEHGSSVTLRIRYSQVRLTGHDFLSIGTGTRTTTNYPGLPLQDANPANETVDVNGGRVFYTSTDQDGNFRVGGLFNVEQATGVATLNADAFNIAGLQELQLGSVALGGTGATITEFSTDPFFTADSDAVIPTQRAIKAYITSQIGGGESSLNVNTLTAGIIYVAGSTITTTTGAKININTTTNFTGSINGAPVALNYFLLR